MPDIQPYRKYPAGGVFTRLESPTIVFLTVCTKDRIPWIAEHEIHKMLHDVWTQSTAWLVGNYMLMPEHLHLFTAPAQAEISLDNWVRYWKSQFTRMDGDESHSWQRHHWDTRLRSKESYAEKWEYVRNNPVRKALVADPDDWPFQGQIYRLEW